MKVLALRRLDVCSTCATPLAAGTRAAWDATARRIFCLSCSAQQPAAAPPPPNEHAEPVLPQQRHGGGVSAQREYDKRSAGREQRIRSQHPKLGGLLLALSDEPASTRVWA